MLVWLRTYFFVKEVIENGRYDTKPTAGNTAAAYGRPETAGAAGMAEHTGRADTTTSPADGYA